MLCPLMGRRDRYNVECEKDRCAWYNENKNCCCMKLLAESVEEIIEGQRIIFVREA